LEYQFQNKTKKNPIMQIGFINIHCYERDMNFKGDEDDTGIDVRGDQYNRILPGSVTDVE
jgi:hypothetical protein